MGVELFLIMVSALLLKVLTMIKIKPRRLSCNIERSVAKKIAERLVPNRVVLIFGARHVGKTMPARQISKDFGDRAMMMNGEDADVRALSENCSVANYRRLLAGKDLR